MAWSTSSTVSDFMQRWCPSGQLGGPCAEHGRHGNPESWTTWSRAPRGPKPNAGTVDPKIATVAVSAACAKCSGALSLVTSTAARRMTSADRSEEHTSELQSPCNLVCRLLLEKKKT